MANINTGKVVVGGLVAGVVINVSEYILNEPRLGPGPKTAVIAGVAVWFLAYVTSIVFIGPMGLMSAQMIVILLIWGLVELVLAALVGARLYSEA